MLQGYITYFKFKKGIGFITESETDTSYFFHVSKIINTGAYQGSFVSFETEPADFKSDKAFNIQVLESVGTHYGMVRFHNQRERFGTIHCVDGDCAFTQVNCEQGFTSGQYVRFAVRDLASNSHEQKRVAYGIEALEQPNVQRGSVREWNGQTGVFVTVDGQETAFELGVVYSPSDMQAGQGAEILFVDNQPVFVRPYKEIPSIRAVARVVNINSKQSYALVSGPGIPRAIIGNPDVDLRHGMFIYGDFHKNERGFECLRYDIVSTSEVRYGHVRDGGTRVRLINCANFPMLDLPRNVLLGKKDSAWVPQDGEVCEFLLDEQERICIARKGYPLRCFADLGDEESMLRDLAAKTHPSDRWEFLSSSARVMPILWSYLFQTFAKLQEEDLDYDSHHSTPAIMNFHVPSSENPRETGDYAAFNTGLINRYYQDIFALFKKVEQVIPGRPQYKLLAFDARGAGHGQLLAYLDPLPRRAKYFNMTSELVFDTEARIDTNYEHIISDRSFRVIPDAELQNNTDREMIEARLGPLLQNAIRMVQNRLRWNYKTAVPQYYPTKKRIQFLLPLCLDPGMPDKVDAVLVVERVGKVYQAFTVLRMDWAYSNARLIARTDSDWLTPEKITAGDYSDMF